MKKTSAIVIILLVLVTAFFLYRFYTTKSDNAGKRIETQRSVEAIVVKPGTVHNELKLSGKLLAFNEVELRNEVAGRVVVVNLPEGQFVQKGTLLVKLFDEDLQAHLKKLQAELAIQEKIHERQAELLKVNGISQNDFDQTSLQISSLQADIEVQKTQIQKTEVLAPFDGVVGLRHISAGATIASGALLATIRTENQLRIDFNVPEKYSPAIRPGMKVSFTVFGNEKPYNAVIYASERGIDGDVLSLKVRADVISKDRALLPGAYANVMLNLGTNNNALVVPTQALVPDERVNRVVVAKEGKAHFVPVTTGVRQASGIEIVSGIAAGDTVVISGILFLKEGSLLTYSDIIQ